MEDLTHQNSQSSSEENIELAGGDIEQDTFRSQNFQDFNVLYECSDLEWAPEVSAKAKMDQTNHAGRIKSDKGGNNMDKSKQSGKKGKQKSNKKRKGPTQKPIMAMFNDINTVTPSLEAIAHLSQVGFFTL